MIQITKKGILILALIFSCHVFGVNIPESIIENIPGIDVIAIDPGHGGKDFGTSADGIKEKDLVLDIGLKLGKYITETYPDIKVVYTRERDVFVPLNKRAEIANNAKADLFISIHVNYVGVKSVTGTETFFLGNHRTQENLEIAKKENAVILLEDDYNVTYEGFDPNSSESYIMFANIQDEYLEQSLQFASFIQHKFKNNAKRNDRGVKQAGFIVLRETAMPSVLIETGFISNDSEKEFISSEEGKSLIAKSIFEAFSDYKNIIEEKSSFNVNLENSDQIKKSELVPDSQNEKKENNKQKKALVEKKAPAIINSVETGQNNSSIWYSVQVAVLSKKHDLNTGVFKGEKNINEVKSGNRYKYYIGQFKNYSQAASEKDRLNKKFEGAFVVAYEGDKLIPVKEAIQRTKE